MEVLREKAAYYSYQYINRNFGERAPMARAVFRLMVFLRPATVICPEDSRWTMLRNRACRAGNGNAMLIVDDPASFHGMPDGVETVVFVSLHEPLARDLWTSVLASRERGLAIDTHRGLGILCLRPDLPRQLIDAFIVFP